MSNVMCFTFVLMLSLNGWIPRFSTLSVLHDPKQRQLLYMGRNMETKAQELTSIKALCETTA